MCSVRMLLLALAAGLLCAAVSVDSATAGFFEAGRDGTGSCGYSASSLSNWADGTVALSPNSSIALQTSPLAGCGACLLVTAECGVGDAAATCLAANITAVVVDTCATCAADAISLDSSSFQLLGGRLAVGSLPVTFSPVDCHPASNISIHLTDYRVAAGGWMRLALVDVAGGGGIASVELRQTPLAAGRLDLVASAWRRMHNMHGASWELSGLPAPPLDLRITDNTNRQLLAREAITEAGKLGRFATAVQFPLSSSPQSIAAATAAALALPEAAAELVPGEGAGLAGTSMPDGAADSSLLPSAEPRALVAKEAPAAEEVQGGEEAQPLDGNLGDSEGAGCNATTLLGVLEGSRAFTIFLSLVRTAGLEEALADPATSLTLFAPTNSAWLTAVRSWPLLKYDQDALRNVLLQHVIMGRHTANSFHAQLERYDTLAGGFLSIKAAGSRLMIVSQASAGATVRKDIGAEPGCGGGGGGAGVAHAVSSVLMPTLGRRRLR